MKRSRPLRARSLDFGALQIVNGGKPEGGLTTVNGRGTIHGFWQCNYCGSSYSVPLNQAQSFVCPACGSSPTDI